MLPLQEGPDAERQPGPRPDRDLRDRGARRRVPPRRRDRAAGAGLPAPRGRPVPDPARRPRRGLAALRPRDRRYGALPLVGPPGRAGAEPDGSLAYVVACWPVLDPHARYHYARRAGLTRLAERSEGYFGDEATMVEASPTLILE